MCAIKLERITNQNHWQKDKRDWLVADISYEVSNFVLRNHFTFKNDFQIIINSLENKNILLTLR